MNKSENIGELVEALSKFQGEVTDPTKDRTGYNYKYADLLSVLETTRPLLHKNGLCVAQLVNTPGDKVSVETMLGHKSGQWISSETEMDVPQFKNLTKPQCVGIVITYARRYALSAILGIAQADADASGEVVDRDLKKESNIKPTTKASTQQINELLSLINGDKDRLDKLLVWANVKDINEMSPEACSKAIEIIQPKNEGAQ